MMECFVLGRNPPLCVENGTRFVVFEVPITTGKHGGGFAGTGEGITSRVMMRGTGVVWWCRTESEKDEGRDGDDQQQDLWSQVGDPANTPYFHFTGIDPR